MHYLQYLVIGSPTETEYKHGSNAIYCCGRAVLSARYIQSITNNSNNPVRCSTFNMLMCTFDNKKSLQYQQQKHTLQSTFKKQGILKNLNVVSSLQSDSPLK